jgi:hypothetical protein
MNTDIQFRNKNNEESKESSSALDGLSSFILPVNELQ